jgi:anaphase-promoting complex subunit 1
MSSCPVLLSLQLVLEGPDINLAVTSPAASVALMLMYLRTNDTAAASAFSLPSTRYALSRTQPDLVQLRVVGRALIMWDSVAPTREWVMDQMPPILKVCQW